MVSLFVSAGARDGVTARDIVGLLATKAGIAGADVGRVDVRESHSTVEVAGRVADQVIERASGASVKGRRAMIRRDEHGSRREGHRDRPREGYAEGRRDRPREGYGEGRREGRPTGRPRSPRDPRESRDPRGGPRRPRP